MSLPPGPYVISNPAAAAFLGLADDNKTVVGYSTADKAQMWEVTADKRIRTVLRSGETKFLEIASTDVVAAEAGRNWAFTSIGGSMWKIAIADNYLDYCLAANSIGGTPQNAKVAYRYYPSAGTSVHWSFIPFAVVQGLPRNQVVGPVDLFSISSQTLQKIVKDMLAVWKGHLNKENPPSMIPTYVKRIPNGSEQGSFLALTMADRLIVTYFKLKSRKATRQDASFDLSPDRLGGPANDLFAYVAECVEKSVVRQWRLSSTPEKPLLMGMTFAFPVAKTSLHSAELLRWTKEITNVVSSGTVGKDVVELLQVALNKIDGLHIECNALINDATATLLAQAYESRGCEIGAIFDVGTNGAYVEAAENVEFLRVNKIDGHMVLNTEWGSFGNTANLQRTQFDYQIDRESAHPGEQIFEKLVSSTSVGEIVRLCILHRLDAADPALLTANRPLFDRASSKKLNTKGGIDIELVLDIDDADDGSAVKELLTDRLDLCPNKVTVEDANTVKEICRAVLLRSARLGACAIASILVLMNRALVGGGIAKGGRVGITGNLTNAGFRRDMEEAMGEIIGVNEARKVLIALVHQDRMELGAAVCICLADIYGTARKGYCGEDGRSD